MAVGDIYGGTQNNGRAPGNPDPISQSRKIKRDISTSINWWLLGRALVHIESIPVDENGVKYELCSGYLSGSHYAPRRAFRKNRTRANGLQNMCNACLYELHLYQEWTSKEAKK